MESRGGKDGIKVKAKPGKTLLEVARDNDIELGKSNSEVVVAQLQLTDLVL